MFVTKIIKPLYTLFHHLLQRWSAYIRRQRSIQAMERLDDHLLDDIGFRREDDKLVPLKPTQNGDLVRNHQRRVRLRGAFLVRRRQRLRR